jgi:serine/threonine-protein kinase
MSCLTDNLDQVRALTEVLRSDGQPVSQAVSAAMSLTPVSRCGDLALLRSNVPLPRDETTLQAVLRLRRSIAEVAALRDLGSTSRALAKAVALRAEIEVLGYRPLLGQILFEIGALETDFASTKAESVLEQAFFIAEAAHDDISAARAADGLLYVTGYLLGKHADADRWWRMANAILDRLPDGYDSARLRTWLLHNHAAVLASRGELDLAQSTMRQAIASKERLLGSEHPDLAISLSSFAFVAAPEALDDALAFAERAVRILTEHGDPAGARLVHTLNSRGEVLLRLNRPSEAIAAFAESTDIAQASAEPAPGLLFESLGGLGAAQLAARHVDEAVAELERALAFAKEAAVPRQLLAGTEFCLARALWLSQKNRARATSLAHSARSVFLSHHDERMLRETDDWLAHNGKAARRPIARQ